MVDKDDTAWIRYYMQIELDRRDVSAWEVFLGPERQLCFSSQNEWRGTLWVCWIA